MDKIYEVSGHFHEQATYRQPFFRSEFSAGLPVQIDASGIIECGHDYRVKRCNSHHYVFLYIFKGEMELLYQSKRYLLPAGTLVVIPTFIYQEYFVSQQRKLTFGFINTGGPYMEAVYKKAYERGFVPVEIQNKSVVTEGFQALRELSRRGRPWSDASACSVVCSISAELLHSIEKVREVADKAYVPAWYPDAIRFMQENYPTAVRFSEFCEKHFVHPAVFSRDFKKCAGQTPQSYVNTLRINNAKMLLLDQRLTVEHIAHALGFSSSSRFIKKFKDHTGQTPKQYRNTCL